MEERWKPIVGFEDYYEVSDWGRVRSIEREVDALDKSGKVTRRYCPAKIKNLRVTDRYVRVRLFIDGGPRAGFSFAVHRLVADAFLPAPTPEQVVVMHLDDDKSNNHYKNLRWGTQSENMADAVVKNRVSRRGRLPGMEHDLHPNLMLIAISDWPQHKIRMITGLTERALRRFRRRYR